ncbi:hypothetical protein PF005_g11843 [Phytophthora fragariae]|uniref:CCDC81 HU domain-containing protein n=1 Tax=Phytophthora fragariae TaxID=53985 RepID=A0A6A3XW21_9STRA|nr:hypothetical protein PF009_g13471 [Phytophthora fragariae]KAE9109870.1 hypothetical protein PF007_g12079 [Phytophthora fragariae]KAE9144011.1 hypothetical protein PF006_g11010 [Phytophthora fragariae]KAE9209385.1 hypothetical protein PF005_g11843 [Phytophthora fragariae]KAE9236511.1 hypothetical protein PF002_g11212 [Phytophthora fragariae]
MRISDASHHLKKTSLWDYGNQADAEAVLTTTDILNKATATIRASLGVNNPENIWGSLGQHLEKHLLQLKAANIKNFGAFGFNQNNGLAFVQDPVFLHMTRLCLVSRKRGDLVAPALRHSEQVLDIDVNELAAEYLQNCSNDLVKAVISSVFAWVTAWAKDGQQMRLSFHPVGEWICDGESVDFRFSELFREGIALKKAAMEQQGAEIAETTDSGVGNMNDNQFDEQESLGDQTTCPPRSARNPVGTEELDYISAKNNLSVDIFPSAAKVSAVQSGSPVGRSRYKLRAPTFASIAKQLPHHGQRRKKRADASVEVVSSNSKGEVASKKKPSTDRGVARTVKQVGSATPRLNPIDIDTATEDILAAVRNIRPGTASTVRPCKSTLRSKPAPGPTAQQLDTINRLLKRISNRKSHSMQGLNAVVAVLKPFRTGAISPTELSLSLRKLGVKVSSGELKDIAAAFSHEKRGYIDITKLMDALRGPSLSGPRLDLVTRVFQQMDPAGSGVVDVDGMIKHYDVGFLDKVREGRQTSHLKRSCGIIRMPARVSVAMQNLKG